jgi:phage terminase large subunit-like protein
MVAAIFRTLTSENGDPIDVPPVKLVTASRGKAVRAEPISALYEQGRVVHAPMLAAPDDIRPLGAGFPELEDELANFTRDGYVGDGSPDRADALVWALTELSGGAGAPQVIAI